MVRCLNFFFSSVFGGGGGGNGGCCGYGLVVQYLIFFPVGLVAVVVDW